MDYSLLKEIEPNLCPQTSFGFRLSSTPSKDYVNPGVGQISRSYSLFIPMHQNNSPHLIEKVSDVLEQEGEGDVQEGDAMDEDSAADLVSEMNEGSVNTEKKRKKMDEGIQESFFHPKRIKIGEILLPKKEQNISKKTNVPKIKSESKVSHKFKIV
jgi:hypothetical protein